jgi:hypothetical protein
MTIQSVSAKPRSARRTPAPISLQHSKRKGEMAELVFVLRAISLGYPVSKPFGDSEPYDLIIENRGRLLRIQVKSVFCSSRWGYGIAVGHRHRCRTEYSSDEIDFIAAYVVPCDVWYIIPVDQVAGHVHVRLYPHGTRNKTGGAFEPYREAWDLLSQAAIPPTL